jgi:hypothetical protein
MKKALFLLFALSFLASCAAGPVFIAKTEQEGIRSSYQDPKLSQLAVANRDTLSDIYQRFQLAKIDVYPNGIGFTALTGDNGRKFYYLLVDVRPRDITFGEEHTTPDERFGEVFSNHFQKDLHFIHTQDLQKTGVDGLAFAVHWPVRDLSQCDSYGGFLEYVTVYVPKADYASYASGEMTFPEMLRKAEVFRSLNRKGPEPVQVSQQQ